MVPVVWGCAGASLRVRPFARSRATLPGSLREAGGAFIASRQSACPSRTPSTPRPQCARDRPPKSDLIVSVLRRGWPGLRGLERLLCGTRIRSGNRLGETQGPARPQGGGRGSGRWRQRSREKGSGALPPCWTGGTRGGGKLAVPAGNSVYKVTMHFINFQIINPPAMSR